MKVCFLIDFISENIFAEPSVTKISYSVRDSVWTPKFDMKHLKKAEGHIGRNVVIITKKIKGQ